MIFEIKIRSSKIVIVKIKYVYIMAKIKAMLRRLQIILDST